MHVHLINFQIIEEHSLKTTAGGCSFYELDFYFQSGLSNFVGKTFDEICTYLNSLTHDQMAPILMILSNYSLENTAKLTDIGLVSGLNVMEKASTAADIVKYSSTGCLPGYKYICQNTSVTIQHWYRGWKDTARINPLRVTVIRIRWAKTSYDPVVSVYPYFTEPEDTLMEFPGFVYHCHILPH